MREIHTQLNKRILLRLAILLSVIAFSGSVPPLNTDQKSVQTEVRISTNAQTKRTAVYKERLPVQPTLWSAVNTGSIIFCLLHCQTTLNTTFKSNVSKQIAFRKPISFLISYTPRNADDLSASPSKG